MPCVVVVLQKIAPSRLAPDRSVEVMLAPVKSAPLRLAPRRSAPPKSAVRKLVLLRSAFFRSQELQDPVFFKRSKSTESYAHPLEHASTKTNNVLIIGSKYRKQPNQTIILLLNSSLLRHTNNSNYRSRFIFK